MDNYENKDNYDLILKKLRKFSSASAYEGSRVIVAGYIDNNGILADDITCTVGEFGDQIVNYKGTEIIFQQLNNGLTQVNIKERTEKSIISTIIDIPPHDIKTGEYEYYLPYMNSSCFAEEGLYVTSYTPVKMKNGEQIFDQFAKLNTYFYDNDKLESFEIGKNNYSNKWPALLQDEPSASYETEFPRALIIDPSGRQVLYYNMVAAAVTAKETFKTKLQERRNIK